MTRAALAAAVAVLIVGCGQAPPSGGSAATAAPTASATPTLTPTPSPVPSATATAVSPAACVSTSGGDPAASSAIADVRVGADSGYDRLVIEFKGAVPAWSVAPQATTTFTLSPKGESVALAGKSGILVTVRHVADWTSYAGPTSLAPGYSALREARLVENFEGVTQWGLGVNSSSCPRLYQLSDPGRLVVDIPS